MQILGIDTSCDDTSAAVVKDGRCMLSNVVSGQNDIHLKFSGVVPELASRKHIEMIWPVVREALNLAGVEVADMGAIAVCKGPGLIGSLLVGCSFAKSLSYASGVPLIGVNHLEGHIYANFLEPEPPEFPFLALVVSGGHTSLFHAKEQGIYREVARTLDDAAGEAYDKVARLLGIGFPGGPIIDKLSRSADPTKVNFPRPYLKGRPDFSFSGLKTAVLYHHNKYPETPVEEIAAGFQASVIDVLVKKTLDEALRLELKTIVLSGGVSANSELRARMSNEASQKGIRVFLPSRELCTDNAAMIAAAGWHHLIAGDTAPMDLNPKAYLPLDEQVYKLTGQA